MKTTLSPTTKRILRWTPRLLGILFALFLSIFALDVFGVGDSLWETLVALFMHLLPVFALLIAIALAWRWEWVGALLFASFSLWYLMITWNRFSLPVYLLIAGPSLIIALLYAIDWHYRSELHMR